MTRNDLLTLAQRLREYNHNPHHINPTSEAFHNLIAESASAISMLATPPADAADMGGQAGEEVEVMAYAVDHPEAGYKVYKQFSQWMNGGEWRCDSLMTVAQHQRITAAMAAEVRRWERNFCDIHEPALLDAHAYIQELRAELAAVREQQAIARRAADRIVQLCTTPHESKERFIRRVQSVIEWEAQAINADASP